MPHQKEIDKNLDYILGSKTVLDVLMEFENMLDTVNLYGFKNWKYGEIVEGPKLSRYWVSVTLMYPHKLMPDPSGADRLTKYDCHVEYKKAHYLVPRKIKTPEDLEQNEEGKRLPKVDKKDIWLVTIEMPRRFIDEETFNTGAVDTDEIDSDAVDDAYDQGLDGEEAVKGNAEQQSENPNAGQQGQGDATQAAQAPEQQPQQ